MEKKFSKKTKTVIWAIIFFVLCLGLFLIGWNKIQEYLFFHPWNDLVAYKKLQQINEFEEINIENDEVNLSGWFWNLQNSQNPAPLVIFFTGNAQNSSNTLYNYYFSEEIKNVFENYNLMIIDYPGYGLSDGKPSDDSMFVASKYVFEYASNMKEVDKNNIVIMGYSIGTGVASYCASIKDANGLVLIAPYDKALSLYNDFADSFHGSFQSLAKYSFNSAEYAESVEEPTLIVTSKTDEVINYSHSLDLAGHFPELEDVIIIENANHNGYFSEHKVLNEIKKFLNQRVKNNDLK